MTGRTQGTLQNKTLTKPANKTANHPIQSPISESWISEKSEYVKPEMRETQFFFRFREPAESVTMATCVVYSGHRSQLFMSPEDLLFQLLSTITTSTGKDTGSIFRKADDCQKYS